MYNNESKYLIYVNNSTRKTETEYNASKYK